MRWIAVIGLVALAALALAGVPPIPAYEYAAPDQPSPWPWVVGELVVFAAILIVPGRTRLGTRAALVLVLCIAAAVPGLHCGYPRTAYPRVIDVHASWVIAAMLWSLVVAIVAELFTARWAVASR